MAYKLSNCKVVLTRNSHQAYAMFEAYVKAKSKKVNTVNEDELKKEIAALRNRLEVLEKIVTDEGYQLKKEIHSL